MDDNINIVKSTIFQTLEKMNIKIYKIILFGSRARGDFDEYSDYDLLIITEKKYNKKEKMNIAKILRQNLAEINVKNNRVIGSDIIIKSAKEFETSKKYIGSITNQALMEGIFI